MTFSWALNSVVLFAVSTLTPGHHQLCALKLVSTRFLILLFGRIVLVICAPSPFHINLKISFSDPVTKTSGILMGITF